MRAQTAAGLSIAMLLAGCGHTISPTRAPATIAIQAEGSIGVATKYLGGVGALGVEASFEGQGCCGVGLYVSRVTINYDSEKVRTASDSPPPPVDDITEGGFEFTVIPIERLRLRMRAGLAGEPPHLPQLGRVGYAGSGAVLVRISSPDGPAPSKAVPHIDAFVGLSAWGFGQERTPGGNEGKVFNTAAFLLGVRISGDYGVDFQ